MPIEDFVGTDDVSGLDTIDLSERSAQQRLQLINAFRASCEGRGGNFIALTDQLTCRGVTPQAADNNSYNTITNVQSYLDNLSAAERSTVVAQFNDYIAPNEPSDIDSQVLDNIASNYPGADILYIVDYPPVDQSGNALSQDQIVGVCETLTGADQLIIEGDLAYCLN